MTPAAKKKTSSESFEIANDLGNGLSDYSSHFHEELADVLGGPEESDTHNLEDARSFMWFDEHAEVDFEVDGVLYGGKISNEDVDMYGNVIGYTVIPNPEDVDVLGPEIVIDLKMLLDMNDMSEEIPQYELAGTTSDLLDNFDEF